MNIIFFAFYKKTECVQNLSQINKTTYIIHHSYSQIIFTFRNSHLTQKVKICLLKMYDSDKCVKKLNATYRKKTEDIRP